MKWSCWAVFNQRRRYDNIILAVFLAGSVVWKFFMRWHDPQCLVLLFVLPTLLLYSSLLCAHSPHTPPPPTTTLKKTYHAWSVCITSDVKMSISLHVESCKLSQWRTSFMFACRYLLKARFWNTSWTLMALWSTSSQLSLSTAADSFLGMWLGTMWAT